MGNTEKPSELVVRAWLESKYTLVRRACSEPPDYFVGDRYAVEVTELHQRVGGKSDRSVVEPVMNTIREVLADRKPHPSLGRHVVKCEYSLDALPPKEALQSELRDAIRAYTDGEASLLECSQLYWDATRHRDDIDDPLHLCLPCRVCLGFWPCLGEPEFVFGFYGADTGVMPVLELIGSATVAISRKTRRVIRAGHDSDTYQWWIALVDRVGLPFDSESHRDLDEFRRGISVPDVWSRVIFFDWATRSHELFPCRRV